MTPLKAVPQVFPRVFIDARMVGPIAHGIGRYVSLLVEGLRQVQKQGALAYEPVLITSGEFKFEGFECVPSSAPFLHPSELIALPRLLKRQGASLYHSPSFSSLVWCPCPWVVTVHDLCHLTYGSVAQKLYYSVLLKSFARRARSLSTVSEFSKRELAHWTGVPAERIEVVYNAIDPSFLSFESRGLGTKYAFSARNYFFCLSNPKRHKNVPFLIESYREYRRRAGDSAWPLVLSTKGLAPGLQGEGVFELSSLPNHEAKELLAAAGALVFPSLYEGFGLPPLEAAVLGTPLVLSQIEPHHEAVVDLGPAEALWMDPRSLESCVDRLLRAWRGELKPPSIESRENLAQRYSVEKLGNHMDRIYRQALGLQ